MDAELLPRLRRRKVLKKDIGKQESKRRSFHGAWPDGSIIEMPQSDQSLTSRSGLHRQGYTGHLSIKTGNVDFIDSPRRSYMGDDVRPALASLRIKHVKGKAVIKQKSGHHLNASLPWIQSLTTRASTSIQSSDEADAKPHLEDLSSNNPSGVDLEKRESINRNSNRTNIRSFGVPTVASTSGRVRVSYAGDGFSYQEIEVSPALIEALETPAKDRLYGELNQIAGFLETVTGEPFASMNEFEKLKSASVCSLESYPHGEVVFDFGVKEEKLFVCLSGSLLVFDFAIAKQNFDHERESAFQLFHDDAEATGMSSSEFQRSYHGLQEEWSVKHDILFRSSFSTLERHQNNDLPLGTRCWALNPGAIFGSGIPLELDGVSDSITIMSNPGATLSTRFLTLSKQQISMISCLSAYRYSEKAQILRSSKLFAGVSKLSIKMLAMQIQEQTIGPNTAVVTQGSVQTSLFVVKRGFLRVVRKLAPQANGVPALGAASRTTQRFNGDTTSRSLPEDILGKFVEIGLVGPTHFFGAVSVLEHGHINPSPVHLISCSVIDVLTLSRQDIGKVSYEDREIMLANARRLEVSTEEDWQIADKLKQEKQWNGFKASLLKGVVDSNSDKKKREMGCFQAGAASGSCIRRYRKEEVPENPGLRSHPFQMLGSVVVGYY